MEITRKLIKSEYVHTITSGELEGAVINEIVYGNAPSTFFSYKYPNKYFRSLKEVTDYLAITKE